MARAKVITDAQGRFHSISFRCPGCIWAEGDLMWHSIETEWMPEGAVRVPHARQDRWEFNGDLERPTFSPSLLRNGGSRSTCHSFVRDGRIEFLGDCTHALAGKTVDLPELDEG